MKNSVFSNICIKPLIGLVLTFSVACSDGGHSKLAPSAQGTTDGAGGNGTNGKLYESYAVTPTDLAAYKEILAPKIKNIDIAWDTASYGETTESFSNSFTVFWKLKTWYIAPVSLKTLKKETVGVEFTQNKMDQLALQTDKEIWIDANYFNAMTKQEQADLLMHEYLMSLYLFKFKTPAELCLAMSQARGLNNDCNLDKDQEALFPTETLRALNNNDYQNIRATTTFFMKQGESLSGIDLSNTLKIYAFDQRFFGIGTPGANMSQEISSEVLTNSLELLTGASGSLETKCLGLQTKASASCKLSYKADGEKFNFALEESHSGQVLRQFSVNLQTSIPADRENLSGKTYYRMLFTANAEVDTQNPADVVMIVFSKDEYSPLKIEAFISLKGKIIVSTSQSKINGHDMTCTSTNFAFKAAATLDQDVIAASKTFTDAKLRLLINVKDGYIASPSDTCVSNVKSDNN